MKQVLFILLAFVSFQGFSQESVKIQEIGLEVMKKDLGKMKWEDAAIACAQLGDRWRLPTIKELHQIYKYKDKIGNFKDEYLEYYWCSTHSPSSSDYAWGFLFCCDNSSTGIKSGKGYVRAVRDLK